eukprot:3284547-Amphidinium_carterae.1
MRLKPRMKEILANKCFGPTDTDTDVHGSSANAAPGEPDLSHALLDSGATHVILSLSKLSQEGQRQGRSIGIRLAAGKQVGKIYQAIKQQHLHSSVAAIDIIPSRRMS